MQVVSLGQGEGSRGAREGDREEHIQWHPTGNPGGGECVPGLLLWAIGGCVPTAGTLGSMEGSGAVLKM